VKTCWRSLAILLLGVSSLGQEASVPKDPQSLARWLRSDSDVNRVWQALASLTGDALPAEVERVLAEHLMATVPPAELEQNLALNPLFQRATLRVLGGALLRTSALDDYLATGRKRCESVGRMTEVDREEVEGLLDLLVVGLPRFAEDATFRRSILDMLLCSCPSDCSSDGRGMTTMTSS
jgi:hypothetical protein